MGKAEDVEDLRGTALDAQGTTPAAGSSDGCCLSCTRVRKLVTLRCVLALVLGFAVFLSALFWLPIFHFGDLRDADLNYADGWLLNTSLQEWKPIGIGERIYDVNWVAVVATAKA